MTSHLSLPKDKIHILLLEGVHLSAVDLLEKNGYHNITYLKTALEGDALKKTIKGVHLIGIRSRTQLTKEILEEADKLIAIGCFCIGTNQVDLKTARNLGIPVFNAPFSNTRSVAELVMGEIVMLLRRIFVRSIECHNGLWDKSSVNSWEVRGKTLGIIGYGSIGSQLSILAESFGLHVLYYDIVDKLNHGNAHPVNSLEELLKKSDIISLHVPHNKGTINLIGEKEIAMMKPGSFLINNARGQVVDINALTAALKSKHLLGAAIDVFPSEPKVKDEEFSSSLRGLDNVILTPHIGGSTIEAQERIGREVGNKFIEYSDIGSTLSAVNFPEVQLPIRLKGTRYMHVHKNIPGIMQKINHIFTQVNANISAQYLQTDGDVGYVVIEATTEGNKETDINILRSLRNLEGTIRARILYRPNENKY